MNSPPSEGLGLIFPNLPQAQESWQFSHKICQRQICNYLMTRAASQAEKFKSLLWPRRQELKIMSHTLSSVPTQAIL